MSDARLSLCMIVRDNASIIAECLTSIRPFVDEIIVVDTGSVDETPRIAASLGAKVSEFRWIDDFAAARNASLNRASGDWLFWMDSDDVIDEVNGRRLAELVRQSNSASPMAYVMQVHCPGPGGAERGDVTIVDHVKLFRNLDALRFEGRIHEQILPAIRRLNGEIGWTDIHVVHKHGAVSDSDRRRKCERDINILEQELLAQGEHPFVLFNLGMTYADMQNLDAAVEFLQRSIAAAQPGESHLPKAYGLLIPCLLQAGRAEKAVQTFQEARTVYPNDPEIIFRGAVVLHHQHQRNEAIALYKKILNHDKNQFQDSSRAFSSRDSGITRHKAHHNLAVLYSEMEHWDLAELHWRLALDNAPAFPPALFALGESLIKQQKTTTARALASTWQANKVASTAGVLLLAKVTEVEESPHLAIEVLRDGLTNTDIDEALLDELARLTFGTGQYEQAEAALSRLVKIRPEDGALYHNLGSLYVAQGRGQAAVVWLQRSLKFRPDSVPTRELLDSLLTN